MSKSSADVLRTKLFNLDIPTMGSPIACKPHPIPLKYQKNIDEEYSY